MTDTLIVLNPHAASGTARKHWQRIEAAAREHLGDPLLVVTEHPDEVFEQLCEAHDIGIRRVIAIGGDGTNNTLVNALARLHDQHPEREPLTYGTLPVGTGRDWARSTGIPLDPEQAVAWTASAYPRRTDLGLLTFEAEGKQHKRHFLNITSGGLGGEVDRRVNATAQRRPWTFLLASVMAIISYHAPLMHVELDGTPWFEGRSPLFVVANGSTFGHGMQIAPQAAHDDGLFDVLLVNKTSRLTMLTALYHVYRGTHLDHPAVMYRRARHVRIHSDGPPLGLDLDGEYLTGQNLEFEIRPGLIQMLSSPA